MSDNTPSLYFGLPHRHILSIPSYPPPIAKDLPANISSDGPTGIPSTLYDVSVDFRFPLFTTIFYILLVCLFNTINSKRQYRPWGLANRRSFQWFVLAHNAALTIFSVWGIIGICRALKSALPPRTNPHYLVQVVDVLCQVDRSSSFSHAPPTASALPLHAKPGFLWERGLGYYTWIFYLSKIYEITDTVLLLAKGRKVSFLQIYHHAGVIICSWSAIVYRSPQVIVGLFLNAGVHTLMYFYYFLASLRVAIPMSAKRSLTRIQIAQFGLGAFSALSYALISYDIPTTYFSADSPLQPVVDRSSENSLGGNMGLATVSCTQNSGQFFPTLLTTIYLIPLTHLFLRFFTKAYVSKSKGKSL